jgi:hypothetical protein
MPRAFAQPGSVDWYWELSVDSVSIHATPPITSASPASAFTRT